MSNEIDALVIIGYAHGISLQLPAYIGVLNGEALMISRRRMGQPVEQSSQRDINRLLAAEVLFGLGSIVANALLDIKPIKDPRANHFRDHVLQLINEISPFKNGESPNSRLRGLPLGGVAMNEVDLLRAVKTYAPDDTSALEEFLGKWEIARGIRDKRGTVTATILIPGEPGGTKLTTLPYYASTVHFIEESEPALLDDALDDLRAVSQAIHN